jgi:hypothetical protein
MPKQSANIHGNLLGIEVLPPSDIAVLDKIVRQESKPVKNFLRNSIPREMAPDDLRIHLDSARQAGSRSLGGFLRRFADGSIRFVEFLHGDLQALRILQPDGFLDLRDRFEGGFQLRPRFLCRQGLIRLG